MIRSLPFVAFLLASFWVPAQAADYFDGFKPGYAWDDDSFDDQLDIELGLRYWYSMGAHGMTIMGGTYTQNDTAHILEGVLRIDDHGSDFYAKALVGYSAVINSTYTTPAGGPFTSQSGSVGYVGGDIGWMPMSDDNDAMQLGGFAGYMYWNNSPDMGRVNYATGSLPNDVWYNMVRLGVAAKADLGVVDLWAEAAAVPYAGLAGTYGALSVPLLPGETLTSTGSISGWLYGAQGEVMARFHPAENWTVGVGGRAWYLTGQADMRFTTSNGNWITKTTDYSVLRYGLLAEVSYQFD